MSHVASCVRSKRAGEARTAAFISTFPGSNKSCPTRPNTLSANCRVCITSSNNWPTSISQSNRWKLGQRRITSWGASRGMPIRRCRAYPACLPQANAPLELTARTACDLTNRLTVSEPIARAALERTERRGAQFRDDYHDKNEQFAKVNTMIAKAADGSMEVRLEPLPEMPDYLKRVIEENS